MRVVGGEWGGQPLAAPAGRATRPTSDKVREAMFGVLGALLEQPAGGAPLAGQTVLDLFAGSGALGIEALSRGAATCAFVENEQRALRALRANLARLDVAEERIRVLAADVRRALPADGRRGARYTLVFADPPYERYADVQPILVRWLGPLLAPGAVVVIETARTTAVDLPWSVVRVKRYGDTQVTFLAAEGRDATRGETRDDDGAHTRR